MKNANIEVELDYTVKDSKLFKSIKKVNLSKMVIFKYGILNEDVPEKIKENDFEYLESKIPFLYGLYSDFIELDKDKIISLADGENAKRISETIGVGVGLYYTVKLLDINANIIQRIPKPKSQKGKYLDFKIFKSDIQYEVETKGTINHSKKNSFLEDIKAKKSDSKNTACKFRVITLANKEENKNSSKIIVCDDFDDIKHERKDSFADFLEYYKFYLSFILDSTYYNRLVTQISRSKFIRNMIKTNKIKGKYVFNNKVYLGQYFDKRLILDIIANFYEKDINIQTLFRLLTSNIGKKKFFLGIDEQVISALNFKDLKKLKDYYEPLEIIEKEKSKLIKDNDGVIFVSSIDDSDEQIRKNFKEEDVKKRLGLILGSIIHTPHICGAPCRSKEKEGLPCEKLTFREYCHFHRD